MYDPESAGTFCVYYSRERDSIKLLETNLRRDCNIAIGFPRKGLRVYDRGTDFEDIVQSTVVKLLESETRGKATGILNVKNPTSWLMTAARNMYNSTIREIKAQKRGGGWGRYDYPHIEGQWYAAIIKHDADIDDYIEQLGDEPVPKKASFDHHFKKKACDGHLYPSKHEWRDWHKDSINWRKNWGWRERVVDVSTEGIVWRDKLASRSYPLPQGFKVTVGQKRTDLGYFYRDIINLPRGSAKYLPYKFKDFVMSKDFELIDKKQGAPDYGVEAGKVYQLEQICLLPAESTPPIPPWEYSDNDTKHWPVKLKCAV